MKNNISIKIRRMIAGVVATASVLFIGAVPMTVFAQVPECICEEKCTDESTNPECEICKEDISMCEGTETETIEEPVTEETYGPLTPDGNLTLVDDYGSIEAGGKQFITVTTKSGNYFYIIIDRDDQGNETVHFLNMVDESDLMSLMDDEEAQAYIDSIATTEEPVVEATTEEVTEETTEVVEEETMDKGSASKTGILSFVLIITVGGIGGYVYLKLSKKKDKKQSDPDPDADYKDDEEDYLAGLTEGNDFKEEEITEDFEEVASEDEEQE